MGELSIEEKAKRYDKAIKKGKQIQNIPHTAHWDTMKEVVEHLFPELKESEDERIRKGLIAHLKELREWEVGKFVPIKTSKHYDAWLALLEKQGEQKLEGSFVNVDDVRDDFVNEVYRVLDADPNNDRANQIIDAFDTLPTVSIKVEPKFKVGDWIVNNGHSYLIAHIDYEQRKYLFEIGGYTHEQLNWEYIETADNKYHLWTIQDAKDGDVLKEDSCIFIIEKMNPNGTAIVHCCLFDDGDLDSIGSTLSFDVDSTYPATKEQRDQLEKAMAAAGYTFDFEKKELKKIVQKPYMIQWKGDNLKEVIDFTGKSKNFDKWFKSFEEYEKYVNDHDGIFKIFYEDGSHYEVPVGAWIVKTPDGYNVASKATFIQKPTWSEEDDKLCKDTIQFIETGWSDYGKSYLIPWLEDLKERM